MASGAVPHNSPASQRSLISTATALFIGLAWGAVMLIVFAFWMRSKYAGSTDGKWQLVTNIFLLSGVAAAGLAIWQAFTLWLKKESPDQQTASLEQQRRIFSYAFLAGGLVLIVLAFVLGVGPKVGGSYGFILDNFGETFGVLLFGIITLCTGYFLQQPRDSQASPIQFLVDKVPLLKLIMVVLGAACLLGFGYLFFSRRADFTAWFPELAALLFMSMLCFACLLWLNTGGFDEFGIRLFVLVFGGSTGMILFLMALARAYLWRQDILLGGSAAWQGENAYRFWLCAYVLFVSLVLMFVSFNLARADIRTNVTLRRVMYGYDALVQAMLLIGILAILNIVVYALVPFSFDWTKNRGAYALSDNSKNLIAGLKQETNIIVLLPQNSFVYKDIRNLLENCQALSNKLKVTYISPDLDQAEYERMADRFPKILPETAVAGAGKGILVVYGSIPKEAAHNTPHDFVPERKLSDMDPRAMQKGEKSKYVFKGETEILKVVKFLAQGQTKRKIYVLQGNDEVDVNNDEGAERWDPRMDYSKVGVALLVDRLNKDSYDVAGLSFQVELPGAKVANLVYAKESGAAKKKAIPDDCQTLVVAGIPKPLPKETLEAIENYMENGGKMLVFLDVFITDKEPLAMKDSGLEPMLKRYGVEVASEYPLRFTPDPNDDPRALLATPPKSENPLAKQFANRTVLIKRNARIVKPAETPGRYKGETILELAARPGRLSVLQKDVRALKDPQQYMMDLKEDPAKLMTMISRTPISVAVAVTDSNGDKPRMVVFGDTDLITNFELARSPTRTVNYSMMLSAIEWMAEREGIGALPRESNNFSLDPEVDYWRMVLLPGWLMLLMLVGLGVGIWVVRRR